MKFRRLDLIRHRNGTAEFEVVAALSPEGMYVLRKVGESSLYSLSDNLVDSMFVKMFPLDESSAWGQPGPFQNYVHEVRFMPGGANAATPVTPASDVSVSLRGIPAGYYLKSFRKAEPGELILNTSGAVDTAKITQNGMTLYRPIVGKVSSLNVLNPNPIPGVPDGWTVVAYRVPVEGDNYLNTMSDGVLHQVIGQSSPSSKRLIVRRIPRLTSCDGTLPGIPKGYRLVAFGAVNEKQFYIDTVGTLKQGPAKHRLVLEPLKDGPVKQPEVVEEYEIDCWGATVWAHIRSYVFPDGANVRYTGATRKVVVQ